MTATANLATRLEGVLGAHHVVAAEEALLTYAVDGVMPAVIVRPASALEVAETVRFAIAEKLAILACGSRSKMDIGMPPTRYDIAMDTTAQHEIAHFDADDLTLSVDAGIPLRKLEGILAEKHQFLPLAVPCYEGSTAGGAIASGIDSVLRQQYGTARDFLIGAEFVDGKGNLCRSGGRVVKNVTGYDLHKLLIGSLGTLGVITRLNFRTFPLPQSSGGHVVAFTSAENALAHRESLENSGLPLANLEVLSPEVTTMVTAILRRGGAEVPASLEGSGWLVYVSYEGNPAIIRRISDHLERAARANDALRSEVLEGAADENLGGMLREAFEWLRWAAPGVLLFRIVLGKITSGDLGELTRAAEAASLRATLLLRAAGIAYVAILAEDEEEDTLEQFEKIVADVCMRVSARSGHSTLLHAPEGLKSRVNVWGPERADLGLMRRVKLAFDPQNIFAPGRFVGGL